MWKIGACCRSRASFAAHLTKRDAAAATCLYVAGDHAIYARNRTVDLPSDKTLVELARDAQCERRRLEELLDCEFSYAQRVRSATTTRLWLRLCPGEKVRPLAVLGSKIWLRTPRAPKPWCCVTIGRSRAFGARDASQSACRLRRLSWHSFASFQGKRAFQHKTSRAPRRVHGALQRRAIGSEDADQKLPADFGS